MHEPCSAVTGTESTDGSTSRRSKGAQEGTPRTVGALVGALLRVRAAARRPPAHALLAAAGDLHRASGTGRVERRVLHACKHMLAGLCAWSRGWCRGPAASLFPCQSKGMAGQRYDRRDDGSGTL